MLLSLFPIGIAKVWTFIELDKFLMVFNHIIFAYHIKKGMTKNVTPYFFIVLQSHAPFYIHRRRF